MPSLKRLNKHQLTGDLRGQAAGWGREKWERIVKEERAKREAAREREEKEEA